MFHLRNTKAKNMHRLCAFQCAYGNSYYANILKPCLIIFLWYGLSMLLAVLNNWYMKIDGFDFPLYLSINHMVVTFIGAYMIKHTTWYTRIYYGRGSEDDEVLHDPYRGFGTWKSAILNIGAMSILMAIWVSLYNLSLDFIDITALEVIGSTSVLIVLIATLATKQESPNALIIISVLTIVVGAVYSNYEQMRGQPLGFVFAIASTVASAIEIVLVYNLLKPISVERCIHTPLDLLVYFSIPVVILLIPPFCIFELPKVLKIGEEFPFFYTLVIVAAESILYFLMTWTAFTLIAMTSAITFEVLGILRQVFVFLAALLFFRSRLTLSNIIGNAIILFGMVLYAATRAGAVRKHICCRRSQQQSQLPHIIISEDDDDNDSDGDKNRDSLSSVGSFTDDTW